ncbi:MAG: hypothetical protein N3F07_04015, partial [Candidatus Micrarchaeota archaeon]|nr:hypothetical protein [Candidatus Micrarchaeota archaeon]
NKNGVTNARITDNIDETINTTLTGATAGVTVYSFNENGIRESWTFGAFGEKITIRELTKQTEKFFSTNQYGVLLKSQQPWGEAGVKVGVEFYKIPIDTGKGGFINVTFRFLF